ncbi:DUF2939 domain-containing protein [Sphingomonas hengshuiensis]|uniref:DUF2939 domain-containing protein n=1 Tax=Sphingomonas hengshuiensis TaxID=1609977 RepID=UPI000696D918|nr:DUF2939 domain-containing protein [Sphingomonas hengshuiensis]
MKRWIALAAVVMAALAAWFWFSPQVTLWQLKRAADAGDVAALSAHIDYPALRESVKGEVRGKLDARGGGLEALAGALVERLGDPLVDAMVTPQGMRMVFASATTPRADGTRQGPPLGMKAEAMRIRRESLSQFALVDPARPGAELMFGYRGLGWKLVGVRLP